MTGPSLDRWGVKAVNPDFTTRNGFRWPWPGNWAESPKPRRRLPSGIVRFTRNVCPRWPGDGLSVAKTLFGMAQGGYTPTTVLVVGWNYGDTIAEDRHKVKVARAFVLDVWDGIRLIREKGRGADLRWAGLSGADLTGADLAGANLALTTLTRAHLGGARYDSRTVWPDGYDPIAEGAVKI